MKLSLNVFYLDVILLVVNPVSCSQNACELSLEGCTCLEDTDLDERYIECRRVSFSTLRKPHVKYKNLVSLDLAYTDIKILKTRQFQEEEMINLRKLNLSNSRLSFIEQDAFSGVGTLECLDLSHNDIATLQPDFHSNLRSLRYLFLDHNPELSLPVNQTLKLQLLYNLTLDHCNLSELPVNITRHMKKLRWLDVSCNQLATFDPVLLHLNSTELSHLNLSNNRLSNLSQVIYRLPETLTTLDLSNNPWDCQDCMLKYHFPLYENMSYRQDLYCEDRKTRMTIDLTESLRCLPTTSTTVTTTVTTTTVSSPELSEEVEDVHEDEDHSYKIDHKIQQIRTDTTANKAGVNWFVSNQWWLILGTVLILMVCTLFVVNHLIRKMKQNRSIAETETENMLLYLNTDTKL